eukprot:TRINITY_DN2179_c0_g1_i1.p1 TRINITY_DN2179_c0_g1~~TRINITY_DN2179_c0_g1_i1.p1  ORF type:complete len:273 (-),score=91.12 TRINITY_DN2179_c0_g1_i1:19-837(-)
MTDYLSIGDKYFVEEHFDEAIKQYSIGIETCETSVLFLHRALTHRKLHNTVKAKEDLNKAIELNPEFEAYYPLFGIEKENFENPVSSSNNEVKPPQNVKLSHSTQDSIRHDFYQSNTTMNICVYAKNVSDVDVTFESSFVSLEFVFNNEVKHLHWNLFDAIVPSESKYRILRTKIELTLKKVKQERWEAIERPQIEELQNVGDKWTKLEELAEKEIDENISSRDAMAKLFENVDPDAQRAMMKSYEESGGTVLSTDWAEVSKGKVKPYESKK